MLFHEWGRTTLILDTQQIEEFTTNIPSLKEILRYLFQEKENDPIRVSAVWNAKKIKIKKGEKKTESLWEKINKHRLSNYDNYVNIYC